MLTIHVCIGSSCHLKGSYNVISKLQALIEERNVGDRVTVKAALCLGQCADAVSVRIEEEEVHQVTDKNLIHFFDAHVMDKVSSLRDEQQHFPLS